MKHLNRGNNHQYYRRVYRREFIQEYIKASDRYSSKKKLYAKDATIEDMDEVSFSDFRTVLGKNKSNKKLIFNAFQTKEYLQFMIQELNKTSAINNELYSPLLRLQYFFLKIYRLNLFSGLKFKKDDLPYFLEILSNSEDLRSLEIDLVDDDNHNNSEVDEKTWIAIKDERKIFKKDFEFVKYIFSSKYIIPFYDRALIWGIEFQGRGQEYHEFEKPTDNRSMRYGVQNLEYFPSNNKNNWRRNNIPQLTSKDVSSLCVVRKPETKELNFCQINTFGKINEPMEPLINDILYAVVVTRDCDNVKFKGKRFFENLYESELKFVPNPSIVNLRDIYPCPLAVIHMKNNNITKQKTPINVNDTETKQFTLLFFLLHKNRAILIDNEEIKNKMQYTQKPTDIKIF